MKEWGICPSCWWYGKPIDCPADFDIDTKKCKNFKQTDIVKIGWSGGKDSTCAVMKHIGRGDKVKVVCWIPMLTKEIPLILKSHYEFIITTANYFRSLGAEVYFADGGLTYYEYVTHIAKSGKYKGQIFGFPCINRGQCGFKRDGKLRACDRCDVGEYDYLSIGIAFDETARHNQLTEEKRSILYEFEITEEMAADFCKERNLYSPHYSYDFGKKRKKHRDGCSLCVHATQAERDQYFKDYPEAIPVVMELQNIVKEKRPDRAPLRGYKWFIEE